MKPMKTKHTNHTNNSDHLTDMWTILGAITDTDNMFLRTKGVGWRCQIEARGGVNILGCSSFSFVNVLLQVGFGLLHYISRHIVRYKYIMSGYTQHTHYMYISLYIYIYRYIDILCININIYIYYIYIYVWTYTYIYKYVYIYIYIYICLCILIYGLCLFWRTD